MYATVVFIRLEVVANNIRIRAGKLFASGNGDVRGCAAALTRLVFFAQIDKDTIALLCRHLD